MSWCATFSGTSAASAADVFAVLAEPATWSQWNDGVLRIDMDGPFTTGATAVMVLPDETALPFTLTWVDPERGFEDETIVADAGVTVRVRHLLTPVAEGTHITYECVVEGDEPAAAEVGVAVSADFPEVIAALAARAETRR